MSAQPVPARARVRPMRHEDLSEVMAIEEDAYPFPWTIGIFRDCMQCGHECWVMQRNADVIAYAVISIGADEAHLLNLCVAREEQGRGLGRRMLRRMLDLARWHRVQRMFLEVRPSNEPAMKLYLDEGFVQVGLRRDYYPDFGGREDALVLALELPVDEDAEATTGKSSCLE